MIFFYQNYPLQPLTWGGVGITGYVYEAVEVDVHGCCGRWFVARKEVGAADILDSRMREYDRMEGVSA
jgi:hypothetical protein